MAKRLLLGVLFGILLYAAILFWTDFDQLKDSLTEIPLWPVPAAMGLSFCNYLLRFWKWERYRKLLSIELDRSTSFLIYMSGFAMSVTPGKMGEVLKSWMIRRVNGVRIHQSAPIVVAERVTDLLGYLVLVAVGGLATQPDLQLYFWATLVLCLVVIALVGSRRVARFVTRILLRVPMLSRLVPRIEGSFQSTRVLLAPKEVLMPTLVSVVSWGLECLGFWLIANAFMAEHIPFLFAVFAYAMSAVVGALIIFLPGGLGATEWTLGTLLRRQYEVRGGMALELARSKAVGAVLITRLCTLWFAVGVGMIAVTIFQRRYGKLEVESGADS